MGSTVCLKVTAVEQNVVLKSNCTLRITRVLRDVQINGSMFAMRSKEVRTFIKMDRCQREINYRGMRRFIALDSGRLVSVLGVFALTAGVIQLALGASPAVVVSALVTVFVGLFGFHAVGAYNLGSWLIFIYVLGNVLIALYAKTLLGQPLDSNLYAPINSFGALVATSTSLLLALLLVRRISVGKPLFQGASDPRFLGFLSWACFGLGCLFWLLNRQFQDSSENGFGGIALFRDFLLMAAIARTAMLLEQTQNRRAFDNRLSLIIAVGVFFGLVDNQKTEAMMPVISHLTTTIFYRRGVSVRVLAILIVCGVLFMGVIAPVVHGLRVLGQQQMNTNERIDLVTSNISSLLVASEEFDRLKRAAEGQFLSSHYNYFGGDGDYQMVLGRYASVQQIDPVIAEAGRQGTIGGAAIWPGLTRMLPRFLYPDKPEFRDSYYTLVYYYLINPLGGKFPTLPLAGQVYAAYGLIGLLIIPFITFFGFLTILKKLGWQLYRNVYAVFFFCEFILSAHQDDFSDYAGAALRTFPLFSIIFLFLSRLYEMHVRRDN